MKYIFKIFIFITLFVAFLNPANALIQRTSTSKADSLFKAQKYTEAFELYEQVFDSGVASPAMLMKMAFIQEGLGNFAESLYYLNLYYKQTGEKEAMIKMSELAEAHNLEGYAYEDLKYIVSFIRLHRHLFIGILFGLSGIILFYNIRKRRHQEKSGFSIFFQVLILLLAAILINDWAFPQQAIISSNNTILMDGPSGAAEPLGVIDQGHRVEVLSRDDVWTCVRWESQSVYIRSKNLNPI